jgi:hypothetical protein
LFFSFIRFCIMSAPTPFEQYTLCAQLPTFPPTGFVPSNVETVDDVELNGALASVDICVEQKDSVSSTLISVVCAVRGDSATENALLPVLVTDQQESVKWMLLIESSEETASTVRAAETLTQFRDTAKALRSLQRAASVLTDNTPFRHATARLQRAAVARDAAERQRRVDAPTELARRLELGEDDAVFLPLIVSVAEDVAGNALRRYQLRVQQCHLEMQAACDPIDTTDGLEKQTSSAATAHLETRVGCGLSADEEGRIRMHQLVAGKGVAWEMRNACIGFTPAQAIVALRATAATHAEDGDGDNDANDDAAAPVPPVTSPAAAIMM